MNTNQINQLQNDNLNSNKPIFILQAGWLGIVGITALAILVLLSLLGVIDIYDGDKLHLSHDWIIFSLLVIVLLFLLFSVAKMVRSKIILKQDIIEFKSLGGTKKMELQRLRHVYLVMVEKRKLGLNFYDDDKYCEKPLSCSIGFYSKKNINKFEQILQQVKPDIEITTSQWCTTL